MRMTRREFLFISSAFLGSFFIGGPILYEGVQRFKLHHKPGGDKEPVLVVVQLSGGNDGINTVIPYGQGTYFDARPSLRIAEQEVLPLTGKLGLHPSLSGLHRLYHEGKLAVIQGVGYPKADHSHFRSMEIWHTAEPSKIIRSGWLGRYVQDLPHRSNPLLAVQVGSFSNKAFSSSEASVPIIQTLDKFHYLDSRIPVASQEQSLMEKALMQMYNPSQQPARYQAAAAKGKEAYSAVNSIQSLSTAAAKATVYPDGRFAQDLQVVSKLLTWKSGTRVFHTELGGFDDHAHEKEQHARVLKVLDDGLTAFYRDLEGLGLHETVVTVVFSEFGRRVQENASGGTDHGTAAPMLVLGGKIKGGLYGQYPSLSNLDNGDLKYEVDFRSVYYTLIDKWLHGDAKGVLGGSYEVLKFL